MLIMSKGLKPEVIGDFAVSEPLFTVYFTQEVHEAYSSIALADARYFSCRHSYKEGKLIEMIAKVSGASEQNSKSIVAGLTKKAQNNIEENTETV